MTKNHPAGADAVAERIKQTMVARGHVFRRDPHKPNGADLARAIALVTTASWFGGAYMQYQRDQGLLQVRQTIAATVSAARQSQTPQK